MPRSEHAPTFIARRFHEVYEELAPRMGYETRPESAVPWDEVPAVNRRLMERVVTRLIHEGAIIAGPLWPPYVDRQRLTREVMRQLGVGDDAPS